MITADQVEQTVGIDVQIDGHGGDNESVQVAHLVAVITQEIVDVVHARLDESRQRRIERATDTSHCLRRHTALHDIVWRSTRGLAHALLTLTVAIDAGSLL